MKNAKKKEPIRVICDNCEEQIQEIRFKCLQCFNYDLCEKCEELKSNSEENNQIHPQNHIFAKMYAPFHRNMINPIVPPRYNPSRYQQRPRNRFVHSSMMNTSPPSHSKAPNNSNNNSNNAPVNNLNNNSMERNRGHGCQRRRGRILQLENRIQSLENEIALIKSNLLKNEN